MSKLAIEYDPVKDIMTIEGIKYSGKLFREFVSPDAESLYRIKREDETIIFVKYTEETLLKLAKLIDEGKL